MEGYPPFKDAKIFPGGAREWDWRETGTRHAPGIQPADVQELIEHGAKAVVLSRGIFGTASGLSRNHGRFDQNCIKVKVLQTEVVVERFNELR